MKRTPLARKTPLKAKKQGLRRTAHSTPPPRVMDRERFEAARAIGCVACHMNRGMGLATATFGVGSLEIHHLLSGGRRIGHQSTICLCHYHHQGKRLPYVQYGYTEQAKHFGPSLEREPRRFRTTYGADAELLALQNKMLEEYHAAKARHDRAISSEGCSAMDGRSAGTHGNPRATSG